jgi:pyridoxamine--pyruvate transaminase
VRYEDNQSPVITLATGPVDAYSQVLRALGRPVLYDYDPAFLGFYERVVEKLRLSLRTRHLPVILHGEPVLALEAGAASLIGSDDIVLNLVSGVYGAGFGFWAKRYCKELLEIRVPYDEVIDPASVAEMLKSRPDITIVSVCHHDTPSGTINPVAEIGRLAAGHGAYLLVDAVSSFGGMDVDPDTCHADLFVTGPNKCLGCPPGLSLVGVTPRAWDKMKKNPTAPRDFHLELSRLGARRAPRSAVPVHAVGRRGQWPRRRSRSVSRGGAGACVGSPRAHREGLSRRRARHGLASVAGG